MIIPPPFPRRFFRLLFGLYFLIGAAFAAQASEGRIALVGGGFGKLEIETIRKTVIQTELPDLPFEECGEFLAADRYSEYRGVVIGGVDQTVAYTPEDTAKIGEWVKAGGRLLLIRQTPRILVLEPGKEREDSFLFGRSYYIRKGISCAAVQPESPLLQGAFEAGNSPFWLKAGVVLKGREWTQLIGEEENILIGVQKVGKGEVYYLGNELFRVLKEGKDTGKESEAAGWARIIKNILSAMASPQ